MSARLKALQDALGGRGIFAPPQSKATYTEFSKTMPVSTGGGGGGGGEPDKTEDSNDRDTGVKKGLREIDDAKEGIVRPTPRKQQGVDAVRDWMSR